ncbi:MAG: hypothetical protein GXO07_03370 [Crenarchaeota archaeon]|nr:hypothetical protein [Thermoproteota archaeon]
MTTKMTLGLYDGGTFYVLLTNPNALEANVKIYLKENPEASKEFKMRPRGHETVELSSEEKFKGKKGTVMVEADVGLIIDWGEYLCTKCKRATLELKPKRIDENGKFTIVYEWVCKKCGHRELEGRIEAVKKDGGVELTFKPAK